MMQRHMNTISFLLLMTLLGLNGAGCSSVDAEPKAKDAGADAASADTDAGGQSDSAIANDVHFDAGLPTSLGTTPSPPVELGKVGSGGLLLRGVVLGAQEVFDPGEVLIVGNSIACVAKDCSATAGAKDATVVQTHGTISPGLIDCHNHMSYNFLGEWVPNPKKFFNNRY